MQSVTGVTDRLGADLFIQCSQGTGTGAGGSIIFQVAPAGTTGTPQNTLATALTIDSTRLATFALAAAFPGGSTSTLPIQLSAASYGFYRGSSGGGGAIITTCAGVDVFAVGQNSGVGVINVGPYSWASTISGGTQDLFLYRDAANTLALRNGATAQEFRVYGTTDGTNSEFLTIKANTGGTFDIGIRRTGTGTAQNGTLNATATSASSIITCLTWGSFGGGFLQTGVGFSSASAGTYDLGATSGGIGGAFRRLILAQYIETSEMTAPAAPAANGVRIYAVDNGSGKTQLMALFATGAAQQIAIEP
jgi:hypothetical protein